MIIEGARQIGKTYIIREMGSKRYRNYIEINMTEDKEGRKLFQNVHSTRDLYYTVQAISKKTIRGL